MAKRAAGTEQALSWPERQAKYDRAKTHLLAGDAGQAAPAYRALANRIEELAEPGDRARVLAEASRAFLLLGRVEEAHLSAERAAEEAERASDARLIAASLYLLGRVALQGPDAVETLAPLVTRARRLAAVPGGDSVGPNLLALEALLHAARTDGSAAIRACRRAYLLDRAAPPRDRLERLHLLATLVAASFLDRRALRLADLVERAARALDPAPGDRIAHANVLRAAVYGVRGEPVTAMAAALEALRGAERLGLGIVRRQTLFWLSQRAIGNGWHSLAFRWTNEMKEDAEIRSGGEEVGRFWHRPWVTACARLGLRRDAYKVVAEMRRRVEGGRTPSDLWTDVRAVVDFLRETGDAAEARRMGESLVRGLKSLRRAPDAEHWSHSSLVHAFLDLAEIDADEGDVSAAERRLAAAEGIGWGPARIVAIRADLIRARVFLARGRPREAAARAALAWKEARRTDATVDPWVETAALLGRCLARSAGEERGEARGRLERRAEDAARTAAWLLGWLTAKQEPRHRRSYLRTRWAKAIQEAVAEVVGRVDVGAEFKRRAAPPLAIPRLAEVERVWAVVRDGRGGGPAGPRATAESDASRIRAGLAAHDWNVRRTARSLEIPVDAVRAEERRTLESLLARSPSLSAAARAIELPLSTLVSKMKAHDLG